MTRYDDILKVIAEGDPVYTWEEPEDILQGIATLWIKHLGCTKEQFDYMKSNPLPRGYTVSDVASADTDNSGSTECKIYFHYDIESPTNKSTICFILTLTRADKATLVAAYGKKIGTQMATNQASGFSKYSYIVSDTGSDIAHLITPGAVKLDNLLVLLTAELMSQGINFAHRDRDHTSKVD